MRDKTRPLILFGRIITSQREIERVVREGKVEGTELKLRMMLTAENAPLTHIVEETIDLR